MRSPPIRPTRCNHRRSKAASRDPRSPALFCPSPNARIGRRADVYRQVTCGDHCVRFCDERSNGPVSGAATISPSPSAVRAANPVSAADARTCHARPAFGERKRPDRVAATTVSSVPQAIASNLRRLQTETGRLPALPGVGGAENAVVERGGQRCAIFLKCGDSARSVTVPTLREASIAARKARHAMTWQCRPRRPPAVSRRRGPAWPLSAETIRP